MNWLCTLYREVFCWGKLRRHEWGLWSDPEEAPVVDWYALVSTHQTLWVTAPFNDVDKVDARMSYQVRRCNNCHFMVKRWIG